jgi:hypothetical protein
MGLIAAAATMAPADPPPDPMSLDRSSPSVTGFGNLPGDMYGEGPGLGGWDVGGPGPILHLTETSYGLGTMGPTDNNDGHSRGEFDPWLDTYGVYFSGDRASVGMPGTHYDHQAVRNQAAGDRFVVNGLTTMSPGMSFTTGLASTIGPPLFPGP